MSLDYACERNLPKLIGLKEKHRDQRRNWTKDRDGTITAVAAAVVVVIVVATARRCLATVCGCNGHLQTNYMYEKVNCVSSTLTIWCHNIDAWRGLLFHQGLGLAPPKKAVIKLEHRLERWRGNRLMAASLL